jgi:hypothetical protein
MFYCIFYAGQIFLEPLLCCKSDKITSGANSVNFYQTIRGNWEDSIRSHCCWVGGVVALPSFGNPTISNKKAKNSFARLLAGDSSQRYWKIGVGVPDERFEAEFWMLVRCKVWKRSEIVPLPPSRAAGFRYRWQEASKFWPVVNE